MKKLSDGKGHLYVQIPALIIYNFNFKQLKKERDFI